MGGGNGYVCATRYSESTRMYLANNINNMKLVKNVCYGGFSLSPKGVKRYAELKGKDCYFFKIDYKDMDKRYIPITLEEAEKEMMWFAYSVPNPQDFNLNVADDDGLYKSANERAEKISLDIRTSDRTDPDLIKVVEELGGEHRKGASGRFAKLKIVEIPDGLDWEIDDDDGWETIREKAKKW